MSSFVTSAIEQVLSQQFHIIVLDYRVREQLVGGCLERRLGRALVIALKLDVEHLALAHAGDAGNAERFQRTFDGLALRVENAGFERDGDTSLHGGSSLNARFVLRCAT